MVRWLAFLVCLWSGTAEAQIVYPQYVWRNDLLTVTADGRFFTLTSGNVLARARICEIGGHNVTVSLGTTVTGTDVLGGTAVTASTCVIVNAASFSLQQFNSSGFGAVQNIYLHSASWGSASINLSVWSDQ